MINSASLRQVNLNDVVNTFSDMSVSAVKRLAVGVSLLPVFNQITTLIEGYPQKSWTVGLLSTIAFPFTKPIVDKVVKTTLFPFFSPSANDSARSLGETVKAIANLAAPLMISVCAANYYDLSDQNGPPLATPLTPAQGGVIGYIFGGIFLSSLVYTLFAAAARYDNYLNHGFQKETETYVNAVVSILAKDDPEVDLERKDLIMALADPQKGLLKHYKINRVYDHSTEANYLCHRGDSGRAVFLQYNLKNESPQQLEDEIRHDLREFPLPERVYPESPAQGRL